MNNNEKHIESLLNLFMQGETTLEQERELRRFFASTRNIPQQWEPYREMMAYFDDGMPIEAEPSKRRKLARPVWLMATAAAVAAIVIMVVPKKNSTPYIEPSKSHPLVTAKNDTIEIIEPTQAKHLRPIIAKVEPKETVKVNKKETVREEGEKSVDNIPRKPERVLKKHTPRHETSPKVPLNAVEMEREQGEMEQAQQELMADKYIIEQERQEILEEQYSGRVQAYQARQAFNNENPQFIQVVFK